MDGGGIGKVQVDHILYAVFQFSTNSKIEAHTLSVLTVFDITDKTQIAIGYLCGILGLHNTVIDPENFDADFDLVFGGAKRVDHFTDCLIELCRRCRTF